MDTNESIETPLCPSCGSRGIWCDPTGTWWLCPRCGPAGEGLRFSIDADSAERYARWYRAKADAINHLARRYKTPMA